MRFIIIDQNEEDSRQLLSILKKQISQFAGSDETRYICLTSPDEFSGNMLKEGDVCVITEICFSHTEGLDLAERIRNISEEIPIVFYSATNDYAMQCYNLGINYYMLKPVTEENVHRMLERIL